jgi:REP element-mobilizing transposase RayT
MTFDPEKHHRRSIRLKGYDYAQAGAYFVTIVTHGRECLFGDVVDGQMQLNNAGRFAEQCWLDIPHHFLHVELDAFVVMPNHVHGIIVIPDFVGAKNFSPLPDGTPFLSRSRTIGSVVRGFKIGVTKWLRINIDISAVWQRNYYEHIIRNEESLDRIREYIVNNPLQWAVDRENPSPEAIHASPPRPSKDEIWRV